MPLHTPCVIKRSWKLTFIDFDSALMHNVLGKIPCTLMQLLTNDHDAWHNLDWQQVLFATMPPTIPSISLASRL